MSDNGLQMSDTIDALAAALAKAQGEIKGAAKDRTNPHFNSKYATLDSLWEAVRGPLASNGLAIIQGTSSHPDGDSVAVTVTTMLLHGSGQWLKSALDLFPKDGSPQAMGSALTYGRRYGLAAMVGVTAEEDDDGNGSQQTGRKPVPGYYRATPPKTTAPVDQVGRPDRKSGPPTTEAEAAEAFPLPEEDRAFLLTSVRQKVKQYEFPPKDRQALMTTYLKGKQADEAETPDLHRLYLFLCDTAAVSQWQKERQGA